MKNNPTSLFNKWTKLHLATAKLIFILFTFFLVTLIFTFYFVQYASLTRNSFEIIKIEIIKSLLQILVVSIIGGTVAALFRAHERNQEEAKIRIQLKLDFIKRIGELYRSVKKSRRLLRSKGIIMSKNGGPKEFDNEQIKCYSMEMLELNDVQLEIEGFKIASQKSPLFENNKQIVELLKNMESYLNKIMTQFEDGYQSLEQNQKAQYKNFEFLWEFTADSKNKYFKDEQVTGFIPHDIDHDYYSFKNVFSLSYANIVSELK